MLTTSLHYVASYTLHYNINIYIMFGTDVCNLSSYITRCRLCNRMSYYVTEHITQWFKGLSCYITMLSCCVTAPNMLHNYVYVTVHAIKSYTDFFSPRGGSVCLRLPRPSNVISWGYSWLITALLVLFASGGKVVFENCKTFFWALEFERRIPRNFALKKFEFRVHACYVTGLVGYVTGCLVT